MKDQSLIKLYEDLIDPFTKTESEFRIRKSNSPDDFFALTCVPSFIGQEYGSEKIKLMLVGRAVNGWDIAWGTDTKKITEQALSIDFDMESIDTTPVQNKNTTDEYNFNKCAFIKLGKATAKNLGLTSDNIASNLIWSNLYKIAPAITGNPNGKIQKLQRQNAIKLLIKEIELYKPSHILFVTDIDWLKYTWRNNKNETSFAKALNINENLSVNNGLYVKAFGKINKTPYVVCVRPEKRKIEEIVKDIATAYTLIQ